jgi:hypothetical protein
VEGGSERGLESPMTGKYRLEIPRNRGRNPGKDAGQQVWDTILKRDAATMGHIHVCDVSVSPCDDPEDQMVVGGWYIHVNTLVSRRNSSRRLVMFRSLEGRLDSKTFYVYYEEIKRELNRRPIYECRCDERLQGKVEGSTHLVNTLG